MNDIETLQQLLRELFEDEARIQHWLTTPKRALDGKTPQALIKAGDLQPVIDLLGRLQHGIFT